jgi:hypothetical protein
MAQIRTAVVAIGATVLVAGLVIAAPWEAQAEQPVPIPVTPIPAFSATGPGSSVDGGLNPNAEAVISCTLNVQNAHNSSHVGGTINVVATIDCTPVAASSLSISVTLYKAYCDSSCHQVPYGNTRTNRNTERASIQENSAAACTSGDYFGVAYGSIVSPPGYTPPSGTVSSVGATSHITC